MADDGIKLTDDEREVMREWARGDELYGDFEESLFAAVESIVAARVQALTAEVERLKRRPKHRDFELVELSRDAARAELAAANTRIAELERRYGNAFSMFQSAQNEVAALSARLERVRALADTTESLTHMEFMGKPFPPAVTLTDLRAALGEDA